MTTSELTSPLNTDHFPALPKLPFQALIVSEMRPCHNENQFVAVQWVVLFVRFYGTPSVIIRITVEHCLEATDH